MPLDIKSNKRITPKFIRENQIEKKKEEIILKKKETIFNKNLSGLINQVKQKPKMENQEESPKLEPDKKELSKKYTELLEKLYTNENSIEYLYKFLGTIFFEINVNSYIILSLNESEKIYNSILYSGVSEETFLNSHFYMNDPVIQFTNLKNIEFNSENLENVFLKKKFSDSELKEYSGFYFLKIHYHQKTYIFQLFYKSKLIIDFKNFEEKLNSIKEELSYIIPYLNKFIDENEEEKLNKELDIVSEKLNLIRKKVIHSEGFYLYKISILSNEKELIEIKKKVLKILEKILSDEVLILHSSYNKIEIISENKFSDEFYQQFKSFDLIFDAKKFDSTENIYLYI